MDSSVPSPAAGPAYLIVVIGKLVEPDGDTTYLVKTNKINGLRKYQTCCVPTLCTKFYAFVNAPADTFTGFQTSDENVSDQPSLSDAQVPG